MSSNTQRKPWVRVSASLTGVRHTEGDAASGAALTVPIRGWIRRFRAEVTAGSGTLSALVITSFLSETATATGDFDRILTYTTAANPLDAEEDPGVFYSISATTTDGNRKTGTLYVNAIQDNSVADHAISIQLDIEPAV